MSTWRSGVSEYTLQQECFALCEEEIFGAASGARFAVCEMSRTLDLRDGFAPSTPCNQDLSGELATNDSCLGILANGWWQRTIDQINEVTIHHTYGWVDLYTFCEWYVNSKGGRPSSPYTIWITPTGQIILVNELTEGCWHDHTGHENTHLSIGLAGALHLHRPPDVQLQAAARVCKWVINNPEIPLVNDGIHHVSGHVDHYPTACPGWHDDGESEPSGYWRDAFYNILAEQLS